jgi:perosamine synthetase
MIPYGRQDIDEDDIRAVMETLRSDWVTNGPRVDGFEEAVADFVGAKRGIAVSSGTAALHASMFALGIGPRDEVIVPPITFAATANSVVYMGARPVFADVEPDALLIDPAQVETRITEQTKAIIGVDYAGHPCDWDALRDIADRHDLWLVADGCHALGAEYKGRKVGGLADVNVFSFHPVKHITTGEGGMITTDHESFAQRMRVFRNHGITTDHRQRESQGTWIYEMVDLGYNYRITDFQCALGRSQLKKLPAWIEKRNEIARKYDNAFQTIEGVIPLKKDDHVKHAFHLYVVRLEAERIGKNRTQIFNELRSAGIGVNVHYIPVHLHPYYRNQLGTKRGDCPIAEGAYEQILSLPIYPKMSDTDVEFVIEQVIRAVIG